MEVAQVPVVTARRLPMYYRYLLTLRKLGKERVSSTEVSTALQIEPATVRRDFSYLGELGKRGYGYSVSYLVEFLQGYLLHDEQVGVIVIGSGRAGINVSGHDQVAQLRLLAAFDVDAEAVHRRIDGIAVRPLSELSEFALSTPVEIAVLTTPGVYAQAAVDAVVKAGIVGILNFTSQYVTAPTGTVLHQVDLISELQFLIYFLRRYES